MLASRGPPGCARARECRASGSGRHGDARREEDVTCSFPKNRSHGVLKYSPLAVSPRTWRRGVGATPSPSLLSSSTAPSRAIST